MRQVRNTLAAAAVLAAATAMTAQAAPVTITQALDTSNAASTDIRSAKATTNYANLGTFYAYEQSSASARGLMQFDLPSLPANAVVSSATVSVTQMSYGNASNVNVGIYQMLVPWVEDEATWNKRDSLTNWSTAGMQAGTDRAASPLDTINTGATAGVNTWDITSLYEQWQSGTASNYGVAFITDSDLASGVTPRFYSTSIANNPTLLPYLTVTYDVVPEPGSAMMLLGGLMLPMLRRRR